MKSTRLLRLAPRRAHLLHSSLLAFMAMPIAALAETAPRAAYIPPPAPVSGGSILQIILSLALVLALVFVVAWLLKRISMPQHAGGNVIKVLSGVAVGQRERIVLVEVGDTWLVVGVAPGQVRALHSMPKSDLPEAQAGTLPGVEAKNFQSWLKQMVEKRSAS